MKKIISLILTLCCVGTLLCSCGKEPPVDVKEPPKDEWVTPREAMNERFIYSGARRYDVVERKSTILCPDPLCDHGEDCTIQRAGEIVLITDKYIYFRSTNMAKSYTRYDILNNKIETFFTAEGQCSYPFWVGDDVYFCAGEYEYEDTGELIGEVWHMYRLENEAGAPVKITAEPLPDSVSIHCYNKAQDKIVCYFGNTFFETDFDFSYIEYCEKPQIPHDGYYYKAGITDKHLFSYERTNVETGETEVFFDNAETYRVITDADGNFKGVLWTTAEGNAEYKNFDDSTEPRVWEKEDDYMFKNVLKNAGTSMCTEEWHLVYVYYWEKDENGDFVLNNYGERVWKGKTGAVALNYITGEYFIFNQTE